MATNDFYNNNASSFFERTVHVDMTSTYGRFLPLVSRRGHILDAGCGSGRDSKAFSEMGFVVTPMDSSAELATIASEYTGMSTLVESFQNIEFTAEFDAIWACASLLHVPESELSLVFGNLWRALKSGGILYCSFKYGDGERVKDGRHFTDANENRIKKWLTALPGLEFVDLWQSKDERPDASFDWLNVVVKKSD